MTIKATDTKELAPGVQMPIIGFGVCELTPHTDHAGPFSRVHIIDIVLAGDSPKGVCEKSCAEAIKVGYRHFDSAMYYDNE